MTGIAITRGNESVLTNVAVQSFIDAISKAIMETSNPLVGRCNLAELENRLIKEVLRRWNGES